MKGKEQMNHIKEWVKHWDELDGEKFNEPLTIKDHRFLLAELARKDELLREAMDIVDKYSDIMYDEYSDSKRQAVADDLIERIQKELGEK